MSVKKAREILKKAGFGKKADDRNLAAVERLVHVIYSHLLAIDDPVRDLREVLQIMGEEELSRDTEYIGERMQEIDQKLDVLYKFAESKRNLD